MEIHAILAACPCTDFAVSGARHFAAKDADGRTVSSVKLVHQTLRTIEYFKPAVWAIENPVGRIEKLGGLPPWRLSFDPNHIGSDAYRMSVDVWSGGVRTQHLRGNKYFDYVRDASGNVVDGSVVDGNEEKK